MSFTRVLIGVYFTLHLSLAYKSFIPLKLPRRISDISYKGSVFSYSNKNPRPLSKDPFLESDTTQQLEDSFSQLLTEVITDRFKSKMKNGIPSMSIPPLDPLRLDRINLDPTIGGDPFHVLLNDIEIAGISDFQLRELKPKLNALKFRFAIMFPKLTADCKYEANGTIYQVFDVVGAGHAQLEYTDVLLRTQVNLALENGTLRVTTADAPLVDFGRAKVHLHRSDDKMTSVTEDGIGSSSIASELGPLLFWMLADHVVEEIDFYVAKYVNNALLSFKVPDTFKPVVTWLLNRNSISSSTSPITPARFSPLNFLGHWLGTIMKPQLNQLNRRMVS